MDYLFHVLVFICIYGILAASLNLVAGITGMLSLAHAALWGVGGYASALLSMHLHPPFLVSLAAGGIAAALVSVLIVIPSLRLNEDFYAMATFGFQMILYSVFNSWITVTRGPMGLPGIPRPTLFNQELSSPFAYLFVAALTYALVLVALNLISHSSHGRVLRAIREDEVFTQSLGKNVSLHKFTAFVTAAVCAGLAGGLYSHYVTFIDPTSFTVLESILVLSMVIVGGAGTFWGPVIGAVVLVAIPEVLRFAGLPTSMAANIRQITYGTLLVVFMIFRPHGLLGRRAI